MSQGFTSPLTLPLPVASGGTGVANSNWTAGSLTFSPTTQGIVGTTTNDDASAGYVGEYITSNAVISSLTSGVYTNFTSIVLTPGDWDVSGNMLFATSANVGTQFAGWISSTSASFPGNLYASDISLTSGSPTTAGIGFTVPTRRYSISSGGTVYLEGVAVFSSGTCGVNAFMFARRIR